MTSRFRLALLVGTLASAGCDATQYAGPIPYRDHERMAKDLAEKPKLRAVIRKSLLGIFGDDLQHMKVPEDSGLRADGLYLANYVRTGDKRDPVTETVAGKSTHVDGGYALYRKHCLYCHGVAGAGDGPTGESLFPKPRDYRPGIFKFTSTNPVNAKPSRADLRKTILYGLHGTSMHGFEANMTASQVEQVIDYVTFLSIRGETERYLIDEAMNADDKDADGALEPDLVKEIVTKVTSSWKDAETQVVNPTARRPEPTPESIKRGRDLFLGVNTSGPKLECVGCHGTSGKGDGPAFVEPGIVADVVFRRWPLDQAIARSYRKEKDKAAAAESHEKPKARPDLDGLVTFLEENPAVVIELRQGRKLMPEVPDPRFEETLKAEPKKVAEAALKLSPELDDPKARASFASKAKPDFKGLVDFLKGNPPIVAQLRKEGRLLGDASDTVLASMLDDMPPPQPEPRKAEPPKAENPDPQARSKQVAEAALEILPELANPKFRALLLARMDLWSKSLDAWDSPLRPANLLDGNYKGGRRPLDLYWRIAKGINGAKMPAHAGLLTDDQIWDVVNFVLAVPLDQALLPEALPKPATVSGRVEAFRGRLTLIADSQGSDWCDTGASFSVWSASPAWPASPTRRSTPSGGSRPAPTRR